MDIERALGLPPVTIRTILGNTDMIRASAQNVTSLSATRVSCNISSLMMQKEKLLSTWNEDEKQHSVPLSKMLIQEKAKSLYVDLKNKYREGSEVESFGANHGWFEQFKKRYDLYNIRVTGQAVSAHNEVAQAFPVHLKERIDVGYSPKQIGI